MMSMSFQITPLVPALLLLPLTPTPLLAVVGAETPFFIIHILVEPFRKRNATIKCTSLQLFCWAPR